MADDIWRASSPDLEPHPHLPGRIPVSPLLGWWWAAWVVSWVLGGVASSDAGDGVTTFGAGLGVVAAAVSAAATVLAVLVVARMSARQRFRATRLARFGHLPPALAEFERT